MKNFTNKQIIFIILLAPLLHISWKVYINNISISNSYTINTSEIYKEKIFTFIIPILSRNLHIRKSSNNEICWEYLSKNTIKVNVLINNYRYDIGSSLLGYTLNELKYKDTFSIHIKSDKKLENCNFTIALEDTALETFLSVFLFLAPPLVAFYGLMILILRFYNLCITSLLNPVEI